MEYQVTFQDAQFSRDFITDNLRVHFRVNIVERDLIGTPYEKPTNHSLEVVVTDYLMDHWRIEGAIEPNVISDDMVKIAYQIVEHHLRDLLFLGTSLTRQLPIRELSTKTEPKSCPYNIENIKYPEILTFTVIVRSDAGIEVEPSKTPITDVETKSNLMIVTATKVEARALFKVFEDEFGTVATPLSSDWLIYHKLGTIKEFAVYMVMSEMGSSGPGGSILTVRKGIDIISPSAVIMLGIAFGVDKNRQSIGDILVSDRIMLYEPGRIGTEADNMIRVPRGDRPHASQKLLSFLRNADLHWDESTADVSFGLILTGEKLIDNIDFREQLQSLESEAIGGEMEAAGLYAACEEAKVDWIVVKAICDWADGRKSENKNENQLLAASNSAKFVLTALNTIPLSY